jgi:FkbM family methyltransferase
MSLLESWSDLYRHYRAAKKAAARAELVPQHVERLGFKLTAENADMRAGTFEPRETALMLAVLDDVDLLLNVGANAGYYCCLALSRGKKCIAVEPMYDNLQLLQKNLVANGWDRDVAVHPVAASDHEGIVQIYGAATGASLVKGWSGSVNSTYIPALRLDTLLPNGLPARSLVLMDIEGHELAALRGASRLLDNPAEKPLWVVEISIDEHWPEGQPFNPGLLETFDLFWAAGYRSYTADAAMREVTRSELTAVRDSRRNTLETHNFLFTDKPETDVRRWRDRMSHPARVA